MKVKEAVDLAKQHVQTLFADEGARNIGLEEVEFDEGQSTWIVTVGFSRAWDSPQNPLAALAGAPGPNRSYKVVRLRDGDRQVVSVKSFVPRA